MAQRIIPHEKGRPPIVQMFNPIDVYFAREADFDMNPFVGLVCLLCECRIPTTYNTAYNLNIAKHVKDQKHIQNCIEQRGEMSVITSDQLKAMSKSMKKKHDEFINTTSSKIVTLLTTENNDKSFLDKHLTTTCDQSEFCLGCNNLYATTLPNVTTAQGHLTRCVKKIKQKGVIRIVTSTTGRSPEIFYNYDNVTLQEMVTTYVTNGIPDCRETPTQPPKGNWYRQTYFCKEIHALLTKLGFPIDVVTNNTTSNKNIEIINTAVKFLQVGSAFKDDVTDSKAAQEQQLAAPITTLTKLGFPIDVVTNNTTSNENIDIINTAVKFLQVGSAFKDDVTDSKAAQEQQLAAPITIRALTTAEVQQINDAMSHQNGNTNIVARTKNDTYSVKQLSFRTLLPKEWVNDEVIHSFLYLLQRRDEEFSCMNTNKQSYFFKSFFITKLLNHGHSTKHGEYCYTNVKSWSKKVPGAYRLRVCGIIV